MFLHFFLSIFICFCVKNPKTHKKLKIQKVFIDIIVYCHKHVLPCTFVLMALCIYECNLFFMYSYHTSIWLGKMENDLYENVWCPRSQRLAHKIEILKISGVDLKKRCIDSKRSNDMMCMKLNEKLQNYVIKFMWEVIYAYFYNWDLSHFLVQIVYDLVELIIETSH